MAFHNLEFLFGEPARLVENTVRNGDLAYVMKNGSARYLIDFRLRKIIFGIHFAKLDKKLFGKAADSLNVLSGFAVTKLYYIRKGFYHRLVNKIKLIYFFLKKRFKIVSVTVKFNNVIDTAFYKVGHNRLRYNIRGA